MVFSWPNALAGLARWIFHGWSALRHSLDLRLILTSAYLMPSVRSIAEIRAFIERWPRACLDTSFHRTIFSSRVYPEPIRRVYSNS
jgi:hypothetical protein